MSITTSPSTVARRDAHSIAASIDSTRRRLNPAGSSFSPSKGPHWIVRAPPENRSRTPSELARKPSAPCSTPAFAISPSSFPTRAINSGLGTAPASQCASVLCMIMNRMW
jgi:hypothetical protein